MEEALQLKKIYSFIERERERERESERESRGVAEREGERIPGRVCTISMEPDIRLEPTDCEIMT